LLKVAMVRVLQHGKSAVLKVAARPAFRWVGFAIVAAVALLAAFALPKAQPKAQAVRPDEAPIVAAESALGDALHGNDRNKARRLLALQFARVDAGGVAHARKDFLADRTPLAPAPLSEVKTRNFGLMALRTGHRSTSVGGDVFALDVWAKQKGTWRVLLMQEVPLSVQQASVGVVDVANASTAATPSACDNPCKTVPYRVRSTAERDVLGTFQTMMSAIVAGAPDQWSKHVADDFVAYSSGQSPVGKADRMAAIGQNEIAVPEVRAMRLAVYGDSAFMMTTEAASHVAYRVARIFVRRDARWLLTLTAQTEVQ
jgi:Domain of unknown function (DUF4440)